MGELRIMGLRGDEKLEWDPSDEDQTKAAHERFKALRKNGFEAYEVADAKGKKIDRWNKNLGKVIMAPGARSPAQQKAGTRSKAMAGGPVHGEVVRTGR